jgi:DNA-binding Lrp family transcriptional regulator
MLANLEKAEKAILSLLRRNSIVSHQDIIRELESKARISLKDADVKDTIEKLIKQGKIKRFFAVLNPLVLRSYGYKVYLIALGAVGFINPLNQLKNILSQPRWQRIVSAYSVYGDLDFIFRLEGTQDDLNEFRKLLEPFAITVGVIEVDEPIMTWGFKARELLVSPFESSFNNYKEDLKKLQSDCRQYVDNVGQHRIQELIKNGLILGFTILENHRITGGIKAFIGLKFYDPSEKIIKLAIEDLLARKDVVEKIQWIYYGTVKYSPFHVIIEVLVEDYYDLNELTNSIYHASRTALETQTYLVSEILNEVVVEYRLEDILFGKFGTEMKGIKLDFIEALDQAQLQSFISQTPTRRLSILYMYGKLSSFNLSHIDWVDLRNELDNGKKTFLSAILNRNVSDYKNAVVACGRACEGYLSRTERLRFEAKGGDNWIQWHQNTLKLDKPITKDKSLGYLVYVAQQWNKNFPNEPIASNEDLKLLAEVAEIRNSCAHWTEGMDIDRVEFDTFLALVKTLTVISKWYTRDIADILKERKIEEKITIEERLSRLDQKITALMDETKKSHNKQLQYAERILEQTGEIRDILIEYTTQHPQEVILFIKNNVEEIKEILLEVENTLKESDPRSSKEARKWYVIMERGLDISANIVELIQFISGIPTLKALLGTVQALRAWNFLRNMISELTKTRK